MPNGLPLTVEYVMQVRARGPGRTNIGIAAIDDPFLLDTDPVQPGAPLALALVPVPEPGTGILAAVGLVLLARRRRREASVSR